MPAAAVAADLRSPASLLDSAASTDTAASGSAAGPSTAEGAGGHGAPSGQQQPLDVPQEHRAPGAAPPGADPLGADPSQEGVPAQQAPDHRSLLSWEACHSLPER